jgi:predicted TIM-barrel fold metal-dependent hydrolase
MAIQMHFLPYYAPQIYDLAAHFPDLPVILDHLARFDEGTPADFAAVLRLAKLPRIYMKYSNAKSLAIKPSVKKVYEAYGPDRMMWGYFGHDRGEFDKQVEMLDAMFDYVSEDDREKIRGGNALKLFGWNA